MEAYSHVSFVYMNAFSGGFSTTRAIVSVRPESDVSKPRDSLSTGTPKGGLYFKGSYKTNDPSNPLVTVVTVEKNAGSGLEDTIQSVLNQDYPNLEYIIIDGASTDTTLQIIRKHEEFVDLWISEADTGFYNGLNKAILLSTGEFIHVLNADDLYLDKKIVSRFVRAFQETNADLVYSDTLALDRANARGWIRYSQLTKFHLANSGFPQQAFFYRRSLFDRIGFFDESFRVAGDYEFLMRAVLKHNIPKAYLNGPFIIFSRGGMSAKHEERKKALSPYYSRWELWLFTRKWFQKLFHPVDCFYRIGPLEWLVRKLFRLWTT